MRQAAACVEEHGICALDCVPVPIKLGVSNVTASELSEKTRIAFPSGVGTTVCAPGTGIVAVTLPVETSIRSTAPGNSPGMLRLGTAAKAVTLSVHTKKLSLGPSRATVDDIASCVFSMIPSLLSPGLKINVRSRLGLTAIIPAPLMLLPSDCKEIEKRDSWSLEASTISIAGDPPPNEFGSRGLETKALKVRPL